MRDTFTKRSPTAPRSYPAEAAGLAWLRAAGPEAAAVVEVIEVSEHHITVRRLDPVRPTGAAMEAFGWALAATHAAGAEAFGAASGRAGTRTASSAPSRSACDPSRPGATSTPSSDSCRTPSTRTGSARSTRDDRDLRRARLRAAAGREIRRPGRSRPGSTAISGPGTSSGPAAGRRPDRSRRPRWAPAHRPGHAGPVRGTGTGRHPRGLRRGRRASRRLARPDRPAPTASRCWSTPSPTDPATARRPAGSPSATSEGALRGVIRGLTLAMPQAQPDALIASYRRVAQPSDAQTSDGKRRRTSLSARGGRGAAAAPSRHRRWRPTA